MLAFYFNKQAAFRLFITFDYVIRRILYHTSHIAKTITMLFSKQLLTCFLALFYLSDAVAQSLPAPDSLYNRTTVYQGGRYGSTVSAQQFYDATSGFFVHEYATHDKIYLTCTNSCGVELWSKVLSTTLSSINIDMLSDGDIVVLSQIFTDTEYNDSYITYSKIDKWTGQTRWSKRLNFDYPQNFYLGFGHLAASKNDTTSPGSAYISMRYATCFYSGNSLLTKMDINGNAVWQKHLDKPNYYQTMIAAMPDGGVITTYQKQNYTDNNQDSLGFLRFNASGVVIKKQIIGAPNGVSVLSGVVENPITHTLDFIGKHYTLDNRGFAKVERPFIATLDSSDNIVAKRIFHSENTGSMYLSKGEIDLNGNVYIGVFPNNYGSSQSLQGVIKLDKNLNIIVEKTAPKNYSTNIIPTIDIIKPTANSTNEKVMINYTLTNPLDELTTKNSFAVTDTNMTLCGFDQTNWIKTEPMGFYTQKFKMNTIENRTLNTVNDAFSMANSTTESEMLCAAPYLIRPNLGKRYMMCNDTSFQFNVQSPMFTEYTWQDGSHNPTYTVQQAGEYWVKVRTICGDDYTDTVQVVAMMPSISITQDTTPISCTNPGTKLYASAGFDYYNWSINGSGYNTSATYISQSGIYTVTATSINGCSTTADIRIEAQFPILGRLHYTAPQARCINDIASIKIDSVTSWYPSRSLQHLNLTYSIDSTAFTSIPVFNNLTAGVHSIEVRGDSICPLKDNIWVIPPDTLRFGYPRDTTIDKGKSVQTTFWTAYEQANKMRSAEWQPSERTASPNLINNTFAPDTTTTYTFTVTDTAGCVTTRQFTISVRVPPTIEQENTSVYIPNAFSPDNDGNNDFFTVFGGKDVVMIENMEIFDRRGELLFAIQNIPPNNEALGWNGLFKGVNVLPQVLVCKVLVRLKNGEVRQIVTDFTLLR
jgi:gliding motility-associated-like protein